jgi:hypothetical protein
MNNKPTFLICDTTNALAIEGIKLDIAIDLAISQFLNQKEKLSYLKGLKKHTVSHETFHILNTFVKNDDNNQMPVYANWVKKIAQSPETMNETYSESAVNSLISEKIAKGAKTNSQLSSKRDLGLEIVGFEAPGELIETVH